MPGLSLPEPWLSLARKLGGVEALAERLHTTTRSVNRWAKGERVPSGMEQVYIRWVFAEFDVSPPKFK